MKAYYVEKVKARLEMIFGDLAKEGVHNKEDYRRLLDPDDNDFIVNLEDIVLSPVFSLVRELTDNWEIYYDADIVISDHPKHRELAAAIARTFGLTITQLAELYRLSVKVDGDIFACRQRLEHYLDSLLIS